MTDEEREAIEARLDEQALPAMGRIIQSAFGGREARLSIPALETDDDLVLARFLSSDVPALLAENAELRAEVERLRGLLVSEVEAAWSEGLQPAVEEGSVPEEQVSDYWHRSEARARLVSLGLIEVTE